MSLKIITILVFLFAVVTNCGLAYGQTSIKFLADLGPIALYGNDAANPMGFSPNGTPVKTVGSKIQLWRPGIGWSTVFTLPTPESATFLRILDSDATMFSWLGDNSVSIVETTFENVSDQAPIPQYFEDVLTNKEGALILVASNYYATIHSIIYQHGIRENLPGLWIQSADGRYAGGGLGSAYLFLQAAVVDLYNKDTVIPIILPGSVPYTSVVCVNKSGWMIIAGADINGSTTTTYAAKIGEEKKYVTLPLSDKFPFGPLAVNGNGDVLARAGQSFEQSYLELRGNDDKYTVYNLRDNLADLGYAYDAVYAIDLRGNKILCEGINNLAPNKKPQIELLLLKIMRS